MARLHVAHVIGSLQVGGLENGVVNVVNGLDDGFRHTVVCVGRGGPLERRLHPDVDVITLDKADDQPMRLAALKLTSVLRRLAADVVHSRNWAAIEAVLAAALAGVPVRIHNEEGWEASDPAGRNRRRNIIRRVVTPLADRVVVVSRDLERWLVDTVGVARRKIVLVPNGVDTRRFSDARPAGRKAVLGLADSIPVIGTIGRLAPVKNYADLIRAFASTALTHPDAVLVFAGDGPSRHELDELVRTRGLAGRVRFLGARDDVAELLRAFDVFALSSIKEGLSFTMLEAMASGLPIVATRVGGNAELVESGVSGTLVAAGDPGALATALGRYLTHPALAAAHGRGARRRAVERFGVDVMLDGYRELYRSLSAAKRGRALALASGA